MSWPQIVPVLDLLGGVVVRGIAGQRAQYQPNRSLLLESADPVQTAEAIHAQFGWHRFYVADLDAIMGRGDHFDHLRILRERGFEILLDAGVRQESQVAQWCSLDVELVIGLETLQSWGDLQRLVEIVPASRLCFSLDLSHGRPLGALGHEGDPIEIFERVWSLGVRKYIVLDLAAVGVNQGVPTLELCWQLRAHAVGATLMTGGGIRDETDIRDASRFGVDAVLIASALHDGRLRPRLGNR